MKVTMSWHGGINYAVPDGTDCERFSSLKIACDIFAARADNWDGRTPCVEESEALVWKGWLDDTTDIYPDLRLTMGPRGGVRVERC